MTRIVTGVVPDGRSPRAVRAELVRLVESGVELAPAGRAARDPGRLLNGGYAPRAAVRLFDATYYLTGQRFDDDIHFLVGYVVLHGPGGRARRIHPRLFYKDPSLVFRVATHYVRTHGENWIGKGDLKWERTADGEVQCSAEETTNLPFEIQAAVDAISRQGGKRRRDDEAVPLLLRSAPSDRIAPYADFTRPRRAAARSYRVHGGRRVARFRRRGDPRSLVFAPGYEPDFARGVLEHADSASKLYGGAIRKFRILSRNREIQYQLVAAPRHVWVNPPQALTTELSTYGVRTVDVLADEDLFVPGYEYHYVDETEDPPELHTQIPAGFAGDPAGEDPQRADASAWIEELPVVREFRRRVLGE